MAPVPARPIAYSYAASYQARPPSPPAGEIEGWSVLGQVDPDVLDLKVILEAPRAELATDARLLVAAPRSLSRRRLRVVYPHDAGAKRPCRAQPLFDVAGPNGGGEPVVGVVR